MNEPLISVIVPVYKVEKYLDECVESIVNQTYRNLEIILVDDGSPDNCPQMCDDWAKKDERIRVIHKENGGLSSARNAGLDVCKGEYIAFVDSDDWISKDFFEILELQTITNSLDLAICNIVRVDNIRTILSDNADYPLFLLDNRNNIFTGRELIPTLLGDEWAVGVISCSKLYHRDLLPHLRFIEGMVHEDVFLSHHLLYNSMRIMFCPNALYYYRMSDNSIMRSSFSAKRLDAFVAYEDRIAFYEEHNFEYLNCKNILREYYCLRGVKKDVSYRDRMKTNYFKYRKKLRKNVIRYHKDFSAIQVLKCILLL